jgi:hypothetical protein
MFGWGLFEKTGGSNGKGQIASAHKMEMEQRGERLINWGLGEITMLTCAHKYSIKWMVTSVTS